MKQIVNTAWLAAIALTLLAIVSYYLVMPEPAVNRFDYYGHARSYASKEGIILCYLVMYLVCNAIALRLLRLAKPGLQNRSWHWRFMGVPNAHQWLATPEDEAEFFDRMRTEQQLLGIVLNLAVLVLAHLQYIANIRSPYFMIWENISIAFFVLSPFTLIVTRLFLYRK